MTLVVLVGSLASIGPSRATAASVAPCSATMVRITDYNTVVGTGHVNDLFWIRNVSRQECTLRGYIRAGFVGVDGIGTPYKNPHVLAVRETHLRGDAGNEVGGISDGLQIPTVTLRPGGSVASFWLDGLDIPVGNSPGPCIISHEMLVWLPGSPTFSVVQPLRSNGFYWCGGFAALPVVAGASGSDPSKRLSYYFGIPG